MKKRLDLATICVVMAFVASLNGCSSVHMDAKKLKQSLSGLSVTIRTFDEESNVIDRVSGKSIDIVRDDKFDSSDEAADSSVLKISIGSNEMSHVGSSLIMAEDGLDDVFSEYNKTVNVDNDDSGLPILNRVVSQFKNDTSGKSKTILIRSQSGKPLATYMGDRVSTFSVDIPKTTAFLIDGKMLMVYRCDCTIYDTELLLNE